MFMNFKNICLNKLKQICKNNIKKNKYYRPLKIYLKFKELDKFNAKNALIFLIKTNINKN